MEEKSPESQWHAFTVLCAVQVFKTREHGQKGDKKHGTGAYEHPHRHNPSIYQALHLSNLRRYHRDESCDNQMCQHACPFCNVAATIRGPNAIGNCYVFLDQGFWQTPPPRQSASTWSAEEPECLPDTVLITW